MAIKIVKEPDVHLTEDEVSRYKQSYQQDFMFYCGPVPSFEAYCRRKKQTSEDIIKGFK